MELGYPKLELSCGWLNKLTKPNQKRLETTQITRKSVTYGQLKTVVAIVRFAVNARRASRVIPAARGIFISWRQSNRDADGCWEYSSLYDT